MKLVAVGFARPEVRPTLCAASSLGLGLFGLPGKYKIWEKNAHKKLG